MIITSLLDTDLYKFTQMQAVLHNYPATMVKYKFKCRNNPNPLVDEDASFLQRLNEELDELCNIRLTKDELSYLKSIRFFKSDYIEYMRLYQLNRDHIKVFIDTDGAPAIEIIGPWLSTIPFEVPVLAIVSEIYGQKTDEATTIPTGRINLRNKMSLLNEVNNGFKFADFGTRRRFSRSWQEYVLKELSTTGNLVGTSNIMFAMQLGMKPIGTMAHEWLQAHQQLFRVADSQQMALEIWAKEYRGDLGIALSDVVGFNAFLRDFDLYFAKLFDGCRHDSGDPYKWCNKLINHYLSLGIDPRTKSAVFSDGLDFEKAIKLYRTFKDTINVSFGIGTNLTNDVGLDPLQIVIKLVECNGKPVAKISDSLGKGMCEDEEYLAYLRKVFEV